MDEDSLSNFESDPEMSSLAEYSINYWTIFFSSFNAGFIFALCIKAACHRPLYRHGFTTVGVMQSSRTAQNIYSHISYFVTVVFPTCQPPLAVTHPTPEMYVAYGVNKSLLHTKPLGDWKSTLVKKEYEVSSDVYNEVLTNHQVKILFDPKAPWDAIPEYMVKKPSNCSRFGSFLLNTLYLLCIICYFTQLAFSLPAFFQSEWTFQILLTSMVVIAFGFCAGLSIILRDHNADKRQHCQYLDDDGINNLDNINLEKIAAANALVLYGDGKVSSIIANLGTSIDISTKSGEVC